MAFNLATFRTRTLTAVVFVVVMVAGLVLSPWSFFILFSLIHFGCWFEYQRLVRLIDKGYEQIMLFHRYGVMIIGWCVVFAFTNEDMLPGFRLNKVGWLWPVSTFVVLMVIELAIQGNNYPKNIGHSIFGLIYISLSIGLMMNLYDYSFRVSTDGLPAAKEPFAIVHANYPWFVPAFIIACMWINDTMAYIVGSFIGKTPFSKISPRKTWEGTIGGIVLCIIVAGFIASLVNRPEAEFINHVPAYHWYVIAGIAAIAGTAGDLLESKLKRLAGVKDSGHIMPGHGGFLDRFDSLLVATPFVWLYIRLML